MGKYLNIYIESGHDGIERLVISEEILNMLDYPFKDAGIGRVDHHRVRLVGDSIVMIDGPSKITNTSKKMGWD